MSTFAEQVQEQQIQWRKRCLPGIRGCGYWRGKPKQHILPDTRMWTQTLWPPLLQPPHSLPHYLEDNHVQPHTYCHHLNSSWVLAANLYFPFRATPQARELLACFLKSQVSPEIDAVEQVELEFEAAGDLKPGPLLGESGGSRGRQQTSPDVAFIVRTVGGKGGVILTECKYTETSFYNCRAFTNQGLRGRSANSDPSRCLNLPRLLLDPYQQCHQVKWGRKYWQHIRLNAPAMDSVKRCPAAGGGYQLFRQQALAEGLAASATYDLVVSCVAFDCRNQSLLRSLKALGFPSFADHWGTLFRGRARFRTFQHQDWVTWVRRSDANGSWADWLLLRPGPLWVLRFPHHIRVRTKLRFG